MLRAILLLVLLLPTSAWATDVPDPFPAGDRWPSTDDDEVPSPDGEDDADDPPPAEEAPPPADVPSPDGAPGAADVPSLDSANPFPDEEGNAPAPDAADPFPDAQGDAPPPEAPADGFPDSEGAPPAPAELREAPADDPLAQPTTTLYALGLERFEQLDFAGAVPFFEEVLRRDPDHSGARNYLVESLLGLERGEDAAAIRDGLVPPGPATAVAAPVEEPKKKTSYNPRKDRRFTAGVGLGGSSVGLGVFAEFRPGWMLAVSGGFGGLVLVEGLQSSGIGAVHLQADILPVPFFISPVVGAGVAAAFGDAIWRTDAFLKPAASGPEFRLVPYVHVGARLDVGRMHLSGGLWLVPTGQPDWPLIPLPGARLGLSF